jgi:hypothetical protein
MRFGRERSRDARRFLFRRCRRKTLFGHAQRSVRGESNPHAAGNRGRTC